MHVEVVPSPWCLSTVRHAESTKRAAGWAQRPATLSRMQAPSQLTTMLKQKRKMGDRIRHSTKERTNCVKIAPDEKQHLFLTFRPAFRSGWRGHAGPGTPAPAGPPHTPRQHQRRACCRKQEGQDCPIDRGNRI